MTQNILLAFVFGFAIGSAGEAWLGTYDITACAMSGLVAGLIYAAFTVFVELVRR